MALRTDRPAFIAIGIAVALGVLVSAGYVASTLWPRVVVVEQRAVDTPRGSIAPRPGIQPFDKLVDQVCSAVVALTPVVQKPDDGAPEKSEVGATAPAPAPSTGFLIAADGTVLTAARNLGDATLVDVALQDGRRLRAAVRSIDTLTGLALLAVGPDPAEPLGNLPFLQFANGSPPRVGQWVLSVQSPAGTGCSADLATVSADAGIIGDRRGNYLVLRPGLENSATGAPLFNSEGRVIGVAGLGAAGPVATSAAALPASLAASRIDAMKHGGQPAPGYGLAVDALTPALATRFAAAQETGVYIALVVSGSPADAAGLRVGDVVEKVGDQVVARPGDIAAALASTGGSLAIDVRRHAQPLSVTLGSPPAPKPEPDPAIKMERTRGSHTAPRRRSGL